MFEDKIAFVTGAGSGIGKAAALALGAHGARVAVCDLSESAAETVAQMIRGGGGEALSLRANVGVAADVDAALAQVVDRYGGLDLAVNNAGVGSCNLPLVEQSEEQFDRVIGVNLRGVWLCLRREIALMIERGGGAVVNTASALSLIAMPNCSEYVAAKHGVVGLTRAAAVENSAKGVRVNAVCPGIVETSMTQRRTSDPALNAVMKSLHPIGRLGQPDEIAAAILWLLSPQASFVTGAAIPVDGGWTAH
jgi:NAD(P)-dependent dehydrogenase (short-subunit alcohol dehydrogenase family)